MLICQTAEGIHGQKKIGNACVTRCSISSFVTAGLWLRSGYRGGRVSETKGNALAQGRPR